MRHNDLEIMAAPTSWGVGGWGLRSGPGSRRREPIAIVYQSRSKLIYRKLVCAIKALVGTEQTNNGQTERRVCLLCAMVRLPRLPQSRAARDLMSDWRTTRQLFHTVGDDRS